MERYASGRRRWKKKDEGECKQNEDLVHGGSVIMTPSVPRMRSAEGE